MTRGSAGRRPPVRFRMEQVVAACSLSAVGLAVATLRLLHDPASRLSRFVDRSLLPDGVTWR